MVRLLAAAVVIVIMSVPGALAEDAGKAPAAPAELKMAQTGRTEVKSQAKSDVEVMELRLYIRGGKLLRVEPIDPRDVRNSKATGKEYKVSDIPDLRKERVRHLTSLAVQQESPACTYWYVLETRSGIEKICLY